MVFMRSSKPNLFSCVFLAAVAIMFLTFGGIGVFRQQFLFRSGQSHIMVVTAEDRPVFFWAFLIFILFGGSFALWRAVVEFRQWRQTRRSA